MEFLVHKRNGNFTNKKAWVDFTQSLPDGHYKVTIESTKKRGLPQDKYYWAVVVPMVYEGLRYAGFDAVRNREDAHKIMKALFLKIVEEKSGIKIEKILSTTELTTVGFMEYLLNISVWAFDYLNISIPEPGQQLEIEA